MNERSALGNAAMVLAVGAAIATLIVAFGFAVAIASVGLALASGILTGAIPSAVLGVASWTMPVATAGIAAAGAAGAYLVVVRVVSDAHKQPLYVVAPVFGLLGALAADLVVETSDVTGVDALLLSGASMVALTAGAVLWAKGRGLMKVAGLIALASPLALVVVSVLPNLVSADGTLSLAIVDPRTAAGFGLLLLAMTGLGVLLMGFSRASGTAVGPGD